MLDVARMMSTAAYAGGRFGWVVCLNLRGRHVDEEGRGRAGGCFVVRKCCVYICDTSLNAP